VEKDRKEAENSDANRRFFLMIRSRSINLKHLRYFAEVARRGSVSAAAKSLFVARRPSARRYGRSAIRSANRAWAGEGLGPAIARSAYSWQRS
jgi:hypothetical protein